MTNVLTYNGRKLLEDHLFGLSGNYAPTYVIPRISYMAIGTGTGHRSGQIAGLPSLSWSAYDPNDYKLEWEACRAAVLDAGRVDRTVTVVASFLDSDVPWTGATWSASTFSVREIGLFASDTIPTGSSDMENAMFLRHVPTQISGSYTASEPITLVSGSGPHSITVPFEVSD